MFNFDKAKEKMKQPPRSGSACSNSSTSGVMPNASTQKRINAYKKVYKKFDKNNDDDIDLEEVCQSLGIEKEEALRTMQTSDIDHDGKISFNEFYLLVRNEQKKIERFRKESNENWRKAFESFDSDKSGLR